MTIPVLAAAVNAAGAVPWTQLGAGGLLTIAVVLILTGRLVPRNVAEKYEAAWREEREINREQTQQIAELTEIGHTTVALLQGIHAEAGRPTKQGKH